MRKILCIILTCLMCSIMPVVLAVDSTELQDRQKEVQEQINKTNDELSDLKMDITENLEQVQKLDEKIATAEAELSETSEKVQILQTTIQQLEEQQKTEQEKYNTQKEIFEERVVALYEAGDTSYIDVLVKSNSIIDFLSNYYMLEQMIEFDNNLLDELSSKKDLLEQEIAKQEKSQTEVKTANINLSRMQILMQNNKILQENYIAELSTEEKELQEKIEQYKNEQEEINKKIQEVIEWSGNLQITYNGGLMIWPIGIAGTYITSSYGYRLHPIQGIYKYHAGIDIGNAGYGAPVLAAADGVVVYAGIMSGYGNCVMISHGNNIVTLYGHGQTILTEVGKEVKQGEVIMAVGSTGISTGPHLHFEVRIEGKAVDPLPYLDGTVSKLKDEYSNDLD